MSQKYGVVLCTTH